MKSFSTPPVAFSVSFINEGSGVLQKVVVAQTGKVKSYFEEIDAVTLSQIVALGNARENGVKARFGHPNMCSSAMGTYIGRFKNFSLDGDKVTGDLHLDTVCRSSPAGNLYDYILSMAKKNPDMFGASMAFIPGEPVQGPGEFPLVRIEELLATDLVDDPAATNSLFSRDSFAWEATRFLDENPAIALFIARRPDTIFEFMLKYFSKTDLMKPEIFQKFKNLFTPAPDELQQSKACEQAVELLEADHLEEITKLQVSFQTKINTFESQLQASAQQLAAATQQVATTTEQLTAANEQFAATTEQLTAAKEQLAATTGQLANEQSQTARYQQQISDLTTQVATLTDKLNATPTKVTTGDPQITIGHPEVKFGKELLTEMPGYLKDKLKK